jgi:hypothetical protein
MEDEVKAAFGKVWPVHVASLTRFLIECRQVFDGDLDMFLVLAVIGDRTFSQRHADPEMNYEAFQSPERPLTQTLDINLRSIAEYSGIPRETVRRKILELEERGWITRMENGSLTATRKATADLQPLTQTSIEYVAGMMELLQQVPTPAKRKR